MERRLAAIMAADVVGYSRLMGEDEVGTLGSLRTHREELIEPKIAERHGRIVKLMGDGLLAEFPSAVEAVRCAIEIQHSMGKRNADVPESRRIIYRIGINIGDIIVEGEDIYGDGVNVAARLEGLAEPNGICVRRNVRNQVRDKLDINFEELGEVEVKNIARPIRAFRIVLDDKTAELVTPVIQKAATPKRQHWIVAAAVAIVLFLAAGGAIWWQPWAPDVEPASIKRMAFPLPEKPSIAVLPFTNVSDDPDQEYFADGMTEDLITNLSKLSGLFVLSRNSTFTYKGKPVKVRQVAEELGVRYVLEGSVRRADDQVRINAQLIDATTGGHIWAERYDEALADIFALQDKITTKIVSALAVKLTDRDRMRAADAETNFVAAYDALLLGWEYYDRRTGENLAKAIDRFETALKIDPDYTRADGALAMTYWIASEKGLERSVGVSWHEARHGARHHLKQAMRKPTSVTHQVASMMALKQRLYTEAVTHAEYGIALDPSDGRAHGRLAYALVYDGGLDQAIEVANRALRLDPMKPRNAIQWLGRAYFSKGDLAKALTHFERARTYSPGFVPPGLSLPLAATYAQLSRDEEAREALRHYTKLWSSRPPTLADVMPFWPFKDPVAAEHFAEGLIKAGLSGPADGYYVVSDDNRLNGEEIRTLVFGGQTLRSDPNTDHQWTLRVAGNGLAHCARSEDTEKKELCAWRGPSVDPTSGEMRIEDDMLCDRFHVKTKVVETCFPIFRYQTGGAKPTDKLLAMTDVGIFPFSVTGEEDVGD